MEKQVRSYVKKRLDFSDLSSSRRILCLLDDEQTLSQAQAAKLLSMTTGTCNLHFQRLEYEGLIHRVDKQGTGRGRPTLIWSIDCPRNACITLVFDVPVAPWPSARGPSDRSMPHCPACWSRLPGK